MALITKTAPGQVVAFTVDRKTGEPVSSVKVSVWSKKNKVADFSTGSDGMGEAAVAVKGKETSSGEDESSYSSNWILAEHGDDVAIVAPYSLNLSSIPCKTGRRSLYLPASVSPRTRKFKAIVRKRSGEKLLIPSERQVEVTVADSASNQVLKKSYTLSPFGSLNGTLDSRRQRPSVITTSLR